MNKDNPKSILEYWQKYLKTASPLIKDWLKKENLYLQKNIKKDSVVLDVGCGLGRNMTAIKDIAEKVFGIDNNEEFINKAQEKILGFSNLKISFGDAREMSFQENTFDYTICMGNTFGDFKKDKLEILNEMKRVTKKDGKIIISVYSEKALKARLEGYKQIGIEINKIKDGTVYTKGGLVLEQFSKKDLINLCKEVNQNNITIKSLNKISYMCIINVKK